MCFYTDHKPNYISLVKYLCSQRLFISDKMGEGIYLDQSSIQPKDGHNKG